MKPNKKASNTNWNRKNLQQIRLSLNKKKDQDILQWLDRQPSKAGAIKRSIRHEIENEGEHSSAQKEPSKKIKETENGE